MRKINAWPLFTFSFAPFPYNRLFSTLFLRRSSLIRCTPHLSAFSFHLFTLTLAGTLYYAIP